MRPWTFTIQHPVWAKQKNELPVVSRSRFLPEARVLLLSGAFTPRAQDWKEMPELLEEITSLWYLPLLITWWRILALLASPAWPALTTWASHCFSQNLTEPLDPDFLEQVKRCRVGGPGPRQDQPVAGLLGSRSRVLCRLALSLQVRSPFTSCFPSEPHLQEEVATDGHRRKAAGGFGVLRWRKEGAAATTVFSPSPCAGFPDLWNWSSHPRTMRTSMKSECAENNKTLGP